MKLREVKSFNESTRRKLGCLIESIDTNQIDGYAVFVQRDGKFERYVDIDHQKALDWIGLFTCEGHKIFPEIHPFG